MKLVKGIGVNKKERPSTGTKPYATWNRILDDCINPETTSKIGDFKDYKFFYDWYVCQSGFVLGHRIAKNLLDKNNTVYQSDKCVLVPMEVSAFLRTAKKTRSNLPIGVDLHKHNPDFPYIARGSTEGRRISLGLFRTPEEAFNAYKELKEYEAKRLAEKYKDEIPMKVYDALMSYQVEITD